jgi:hypothetical protein
MKSFTALCGDVCSECPRYIATKNNDSGSLQKVAELWFRAGFRDHIVSIDEIRCNGCSKTKECSLHINDCSGLKGKETCGECSSFPCEKIEAVFVKTEYIKDNFSGKCSAEEYQQLKKAFFSKREVLTKIHRNNL